MFGDFVKLLFENGNAYVDTVITMKGKVYASQGIRVFLTDQRVNLCYCISKQNNPTHWKCD
jgi:hypothetical protein